MHVSVFAIAAWLSACAGAPLRPQGGDLIAVHFADTPLPDALRTVALDAHVNIDAAGAPQTGAVTLDMHAPWKFVLDRIVRDHGLHVRYQAPRLAVVSAADAPPLPTAGAPLTATFDDTPIRDAAATIARTAGVEVTVDPDVQVAVTMHVRNAPWDLALDHLARKYGLAVTRTGTAIRISNAPAR